MQRPSSCGKKRQRQLYRQNALLPSIGESVMPVSMGRGYAHLLLSRAVLTGRRICLLKDAGMSDTPGLQG